MTWTLLIALFVALVLAAAATFHRRADLRRQHAALSEREAMARRTVDAAPLQVPVIDLARCLGCGTCVQACPEHGVLELVHGQAAVVNAALCVGHGHCTAECPTGAVTLELADAATRRDVPVLGGELQTIDHDDTWLAGEITAKALIRNATAQGVDVAASIASRLRQTSAHEPVTDHDVVIVGAGPAGVACALACREHGLDFVVLDQEASIGGTVAKYPRRKLVLTEPLDLPLHGRLPQREFEKEELIAVWQELAERHQLPFRGGVRFTGSDRRGDGALVVHTDSGAITTRHLVLAVGRRGTPRRLQVPGEELPHVAYGLADPQTWAGSAAIVVGGGDSAVEAALALAEQPETTVTIVYRQDSFFRIRARNRERLEEATGEGRIEVLHRATPVAIHADRIELRLDAANGPQRVTRPATAIFVLIGGTTPFELLSNSGVSFDPTRRPASPAGASEPEPTASTAIVASLLLTGATAAFALAHLDYYGLPAGERAADPKHALLRPDQSLGLIFGIVAVLAILANLAYLLRRRQWRGLRLGSLTGWMSTHIATGVGAFLLVALHAALSPRTTSGGHAFWVLGFLLITGAIGRWFYAWLPRAANGRELDLARIRADLDADLATLRSDFGARAQGEMQALLDRRQWRSTFVGRVVALLGLQWDLWLTLRRLRRSAIADGVDASERAVVLAGVRHAHRAAVATAHLEDLRVVLGTWRWLHKWLALLMMLLVVIHVVYAWLHGAFTFGSLV